MLIILLHILFYDLWFYISHVLLHYPKFYKIHKQHHIKQHDKLEWYDTNEGHYIEHLLQPLGMFIPCFFNSFSYKYFFIAYIFIAIRALMRHDNRFTYLIGNHHILHHKYPNYNYGEYWIDKLCGTVYPNKNEYIYGLIYL